MIGSVLTHELLHGIIAIPFAIFLWHKTKLWKLLAIFFLVTYLVDIDHLLDFFLFYGSNFTLIDFFRLDYFTRTQRAFVIFHGWEWLLILAYFVKKEGVKSVWAAVLFGLLPHYILDSINIGSFISYSFFYRVLNSFYI